MPAPSASSRLSPGIRYLILVVLLLGGLACRIAPVLAQGEPGGIGGTGIVGGEETGGIGGTGISGEETGGIGGTGVHRTPIIGLGPIQRFGSVFVNGREYAINGRTLVTVDGQPATLGALRVGDMALVHGIATGPHAGFAHAIAVWQSIVGPVGTVAPDRKSFTVLGQQVHLTRAVVTVRPGETVGVSGQRQADGTWVASRVTPLSPTPRFRLESTVAAVGHNSVTFHGLTLHAAPALLAGIQAGERVVASGVISGGTPRLRVLTPRPLQLGAPGTLVEVHNYFRSVAPGRLVAVDGMVAIGAHGRELSGLEPVDVVGRLSATGSIEISELQLAIPELPTDTMPQDEPHASTPTGETGEHGKAEPPDQANHTGDAEGATTVEPPEISEPGETPEPEVEPPEIQVPEPQAPEPDIDAPENEPATDR